MKTFFLFFLIIPIAAFADISSDMKNTASTLSELLTLSVQPKEFEGKKQEVTRLIEKLDANLLKNQKHFQGKEPHLEMNHKILSRLSVQALKAYKINRFEASRQYILAAPNVCLSCHQNDKIKSSAFSLKVPKELPPYEKAQFAMATRQPELALSFLNNSLSTASKEEKENVLRKKLQIYVTEKSVSELIKSLKTDLASASNKSDEHKILKDWLQGARRAESYLSQQLKSIGDVPIVLKKAYGSEDPTLGRLANSEDEVFFLILKKQILNLMHELNANELPVAYFWMSLCERAVGYELYYSLADSYLITCIENWPKFPIAKKCLNEYESFIEFAYSGSSGTHIPQDVKEELQMLEKKIKP